MQRNWWFLTDTVNPVSRMTAACNPLFTAPFCQHFIQTFLLSVQSHSAFSQAKPGGQVLLSPLFIHITPSKTFLLLASLCCHTWSCCRAWPSQEQMGYRQIKSLFRQCAIRRATLQGRRWEGGDGSRSGGQECLHPGLELSCPGPAPLGFMSTCPRCTNFHRTVMPWWRAVLHVSPRLPLYSWVVVLHWTPHLYCTYSFISLGASPFL